MVVNKRKKVTKYRGHVTHGGGHRKKRRGAGSRGGRGNAGSGKRAGQKVAGLKGFKLGNKGFSSKVSNQDTPINVSFFTIARVNKLVLSGKIVKEGELFSIDLGKLGYNKLLGTGKTSLKLKIAVEKFSPSAEEKIKSVGGEIVAPVIKVVEKKSKVAKKPITKETKPAVKQEE